MTTTRPTSPTFAEMLEQVLDVGLGATVVFLPGLLLAVPGIVLTVLLVAPIVLPLAALGALLAPPYLLWRAVRR